MAILAIKLLQCWDPIDLIFYRERASQPARMKRKRNRRRVERGREASRCCLFTAHQGRSPPPCHAWPEAVLARPTPPSPLHNSSAWLVMPSVYLLLCASPAPFSTAPRRPRPRGPKGAHLKEETKMNNFLLHSSLIRVLGAEQSGPLKIGENSQNIRPCRYLDWTQIFWQVVAVQQPVHYGRECANKSSVQAVHL